MTAGRLRHRPARENSAAVAGELPRIPRRIPGVSLRLWTEELHNVSTFSRESPELARTRARPIGEAHSEECACTRVLVYAPTPCLLLLR